MALFGHGDEIFELRDAHDSRILACPGRGVRAPKGRQHTQMVLAFAGLFRDFSAMSIERFSPAEIGKLKRAGQVAAQTLAAVTAELRAGMTTADIDRHVR